MRGEEQHGIRYGGIDLFICLKCHFKFYQVLLSIINFSLINPLSRVIV
jgi:hypothetical protein